MTAEQVQQFAELGYMATKRLAGRTNAGNANEYAAESVSRDLERGLDNDDLASAILRLQKRCRIDLSAMLSLDGTWQREAAAAFTGGCMQFLQENPD